MSAPAPAPAPLPPHEPSAARLQRAVDQLLDTADELTRAQAAVDRLRARVDRFVDTHPSYDEHAPHPGPSSAVRSAAPALPDGPDTGSVRRVANVIGHTAVAFVVATVGLAIADPVLPRPALPFFDTPAAASPADTPIPHSEAP